MAAAQAMEAVQRFLFHDFPSFSTFTTKDYEKDDLQNTLEEIEKRLTGYGKIILFGLGSMYWGTAIGVLDHLQKNMPNCIHYCTIYFAISLVIMLNGLAAATFPKSAPLALSISGLGAWKAFIFVLATFHIASFKFHTYVVECFYSMIISTALVTFYWAYSSQDPLIIHFVGKLVVWFICLVVVGVAFTLYQVVRFIKLISKGCWEHSLNAGKSVKERLISRYNSARGYEAIVV